MNYRRRRIGVALLLLVVIAVGFCFVQILLWKKSSERLLRALGQSSGKSLPLHEIRRMIQETGTGFAESPGRIDIEPTRPLLVRSGINLTATILLDGGRSKGQAVRLMDPDDYAGTSPHRPAFFMWDLPCDPCKMIEGPAEVSGKVRNHDRVELLLKLSKASSPQLRRAAYSAKLDCMLPWKNCRGIDEFFPPDQFNILWQSIPRTDMR